MTDTKEVADLHLHTLFSYDGKSAAEEYVLAAVAAGDKVIGFSEHYDYDCVLSGTSEDSPLCDLRAYKAEIERLREKYEGKIEILFGIEFGYDKRAHAKYAELAEKFRFDYAINSVHLFRGTDLWLADKIEKYSVSAKELYKIYLETVEESVFADYPFDIIGHLGYPLRYSPCKGKNFSYEDFAGEYERILKAIAKSGKCLEINSSTKTEKPFMPNEDVIEAYAEFGGKKLSFGSDAHSVRRYSEGKKTVSEAAQKFGLKLFCGKSGNIERFSEE